MRPAFVALAALAAAGVVASGDARADGTDAQAHEAYDRGTRAYRRGDYATAAREYAAADALSPNPVALQAAIDAAVQADDPVLGVTLLDRARGAARTDGLVTTMLTAERKFAHRVGRIRPECGAARCLAAIDGAASPPGQAAVVRVGSHTVTVESSGGGVTRVVTVAPDETVVVRPDVTPPPPPPAASAVPPAISPPEAAKPPPPVAVSPLVSSRAAPPADAGGLSPVWFYVGLGATVVAGGLAIASGVDTANQHATFASRCGSSPAPNCGQLASDGQSAQTRTNVALGVTAALAVATGAVAFLVHWRSASIALGPARVSFDARF